MSTLVNPYAFTLIGGGDGTSVRPSLQSVGGRLSAEQLTAARKAYYDFCALQRTSQAPNPVHIGRLSDGTPYRITRVGLVNVMQVVVSEKLTASATDPCIPFFEPTAPPQRFPPPAAPLLEPMAGVFWSGTETYAITSSTYTGPPGEESQWPETWRYNERSEQSFEVFYGFADSKIKLNSSTLQGETVWTRSGRAYAGESSLLMTFNALQYGQHIVWTTVFQEAFSNGGTGVFWIRKVEWEGGAPLHRMVGSRTYFGWSEGYPENITADSTELQPSGAEEIISACAGYNAFVKVRNDARQAAYDARYSKFAVIDSLALGLIEQYSALTSEYQKLVELGDSNCLGREAYEQNRKAYEAEKGRHADLLKEYH